MAFTLKRHVQYKHKTAFCDKCHRNIRSSIRNRGHAGLRRLGRIPDLYMSHDISSWSVTEPTTLPESPTCWTPPPEGVGRATSAT